MAFLSAFLPVCGTKRTVSMGTINIWGYHNDMMYADDVLRKAISTEYDGCFSSHGTQRHDYGSGRCLGQLTKFSDMHSKSRQGISTLTENQ